MAHRQSGLTLVVLFVDVSTPPQATSTAAKNQAHAEIRAAIRNAVRDYPCTALNRTTARMGVVSWPTWFPSSHVASGDFLELTASFLTRGATAGEEGWHPVRLLDEEEMPYREGDPAAGEVIATNARLLTGTPYWLRAGTVPRTDRYLLAAAGADGIAALDDPLVPDRMTGAGFTQSVAGRKWRHLVQL